MSNAWAITDELGIGPNSDRVCLTSIASVLKLLPPPPLLPGERGKSNELSPPIRRVSQLVLLMGQARTHKPR
jgi:hypothetical protein